MNNVSLWLACMASMLEGMGPFEFVAPIPLRAAVILRYAS